MRSAILVYALLCLSLVARGRAEDIREVSGPLVVSENWPECTDLLTWTKNVMRLEGLENANETAQAKAFFRWLRLFSRMATGGMIQAFEGDYGKEGYVLDMHKNLFVYGWGLCDTQSRIADAAWSQFKGPANAERVVVQWHHGGFHTMYRLNLDGKWGAFDGRYGYYLVEKDEPDARVLDWADVGVDENILKNKNYRHRSGPFFEYLRGEWDRTRLIQPTYYESEKAWRRAGAPIQCVMGNSHHIPGTRFHDMSFRLPPGTTIERFWDNTAKKFYVPATEHDEPFLPSGRFYRVTETMRDGNWVNYDPNYKKCAPYVTRVPTDEGYNREVSGGRTIGQAWGRLIYDPELSSRSFLDVSAVETDLAHHTSAPYLRPSQLTAEGQATFDFYSPYVLVDAALSGEWMASASDGAKVELRTLRAKRRHLDEPDAWSEWQTLCSGPDPFMIEIGREHFNGKDVSIHGIYRFQIRLSLANSASRHHPVGLKALRLQAYFENAIMSIPRIVEGDNTIHFKVADASKITSPITVSYRYQTTAGEKVHVQVLQPEDFQADVATYDFRALGLTRCNALTIQH